MEINLGTRSALGEKGLKCQQGGGGRGDSASEVPSFHECILWGKRYVKLAYTKERAHSAKHRIAREGLIN